MESKPKKIVVFCLYCQTPGLGLGVDFVFAKSGQSLRNRVADPYFTNDSIFRSCALKRSSTQILDFTDILKFVCAEMFPYMLDEINNIFILFNHPD